MEKKEAVKTFANRIIKVILSPEISQTASQLTYSLILAFIPFVMFLITIAARVELPINDIFSYLKIVLPADAYQIIERILYEILSSAGLTVYTAIPAIYFISIGARGIMSAANRCAGYRGEAEQTKIETLKETLMFWVTSFIFGILFVMILLLCLALIVFGDYIVNWVLSLVGIYPSKLFTILRYFLSYLLIGMTISLIYAPAPSKKLRIKDVHTGAYAASFLWMVASSFFAYYVNNFGNYGLLFGSLGGIFILLVWLYWTSYIILLGIYINSILADMNKQQKGL